MPGAAGGQPYVFISYASSDREQVLFVVDRLEAAGVDVWIDQQDIAGGTSYGAEISEGIQGCAALVLMCSNASLASRNVRQEIMLGWKYQRPYLPLLLEQTTFPQDIEYWLEGSQWVEVLDRPESDWLPRVLRALPQGVAPPSPAAPPPASYERATKPAATQTLARRDSLTPSSPIIGRERERQEISDLLLHGAERLVTLTGPGGTGKSRLAIQIASESRGEFDEVHLVELASLADAALVIPTIAGTLGLREEDQRGLTEQIIDELYGKRVLLVIDNFEHLLDAAGDVAEILGACPDLRVLTTSRGRLGVYSEQEYPVPPMRLPSLQRLPPVEELAGFEAIALFVQRARTHKPDFRLTDANAAAVAEICVRLDGLPLAIELAAARIKLLTPQAMRDRLDKRLPLLTGGARNLPARQQTLRNAIAWSYDLLNPDEQRLFRELSIFSGGWTFEAAEAIADPSGAAEIDVLEGLASLLDKSLARQVVDDRDEIRFTMLETIREFGLEQLASSGEIERVQRQHTEFYIRLAEQAEPELTGADQNQWFARLESEHDNVRASLIWSLEHDLTTATRLAGLLGRFWYSIGYLTEGRRWLEAAVVNEAANLADRARVLRWLSALALSQVEYSHSRAWASEALQIYREAGDQMGVATSLNTLGIIAFGEEAFGDAASLLQESLALYRQTGDNRSAAITLGNLAWLETMQQRHESAQPYIEESLALARQMVDDAGAAHALQNVGVNAVERGDLPRAHDAFIEGLSLAQGIGASQDMIESLEGYAAVTALQGETERAARLFGAASGARQRINIPVPTPDRPLYEKYLALARGQLNDEMWIQAWDAGARMTLHEAVNEVLRASRV